MIMTITAESARVSKEINLRLGSDNEKWANLCLHFDKCKKEIKFKQMSSPPYQANGNADALPATLLIEHLDSGLDGCTALVRFDDGSCGCCCCGW